MVLCRISDDKAEEEKGVARQEADCRTRAAHLGWGIGEIVIENDTSAFKRRRVKLPDGTTALRVVRPGFRRVLELLTSGQADGLLAYDLDRVARDPRDLEDLIDVVESRRIPVESVTGSLRLSNDADITMARVMVAVANKSSRDTSRRVARKHEELAAEGKPGGGGIRAYGYARNGHDIVPAEAEIIREMARRILDGDTLYAIAEDLQNRGVPTVTGAKWSNRSVKTIVTKPRVAGLRSTGSDSNMQIVGPAVWAPILDRDTWEEVCSTLAARGKAPNNQLIRWLTGVLWCSLCQSQLHGAQGRSAPRYWCNSTRGGCGRIAIDAAGTEREVEKLILEYLADPEVLGRLRTVSDTGAAKRARDELAADEAQLKEMARAYARREFTLAEYVEARKIVEARVKAAKAMLLSAAPRVLRTLLSDNVTEGWRELGNPEKREVVLALVPDGWEVQPFARKPGMRPAFDPARLQPRTR